MKRIFLTAILAAILPVAEVMAQDAITDASAGVCFTGITMSSDPVALSMGLISAIQPGSGVYAAQSNPGYLPYDISHVGVGVNYRSWNGTSSANAGVGVKCGKRVGIGASFSGIFGDSYLGMSSTGGTLNQIAAKNFVASAGVGVKIAEPFSLGVNFRYLSMDNGGDPAQAFTTDIMACTSFLGIRIAGGVTNLKISSAQDVPSAATLAAGYKLVLPVFALEAGAQADWFFYGKARAGVGASVSFLKFLTVRGGYNFGGESHMPSFASAGLGFKIWKLNADVTGMFPTKDGGKPSFCVGIGINL